MKKVDISQLDPIFESLGDEKKVPARNVPEQIEFIEINKLKKGPFQPRKNFDQASLDELATSIKASGILQPILVRESGECYEIIAGERRFKAARIAGLSHIPCILTKLDDSSCMAFSLLENIQRSALTPIEEAEAFKRLLDEYALSHNEISQRIGKSRSAITNSIRLLSLPKSIRDRLENKLISVGHAKVILSCSAELREQLCENILNKKLSVRQAEQALSKIGKCFSGKKRENDLAEEEIDEIKFSLQSIFNKSVKIHSINGKIDVHIAFNSIEQLYSKFSALNLELKERIEKTYSEEIT